ncbi:integrase core domain protein [Streptomyces jeddahensis]|uniref:Integrase core domain protein n=1 Tax=Streptomyces jeddahensis TaxID=1716141 RepID=A0A177HJC0_9ACTN|nr:IS30 family transposase [Streptomyces jeddahensis]OAH10314.1 integrase core domain protein [Streptomyces jeddahensis]
MSAPPASSTPLINQRPAEATDRQIARHWEGDLIVGQGNRSAIGTLVDRTTRYVKLLHLPDGRGAEHVRHALLHAFAELPAELARSVTWDQGSEMGRHDEFTRAAVNGLLRQYFPKGADLSIYSAEDLAYVAAKLKDRPRKILG